MTFYLCQNNSNPVGEESVTQVFSFSMSTHRQTMNQIP